MLCSHSTKLSIIYSFSISKSPFFKTVEVLVLLRTKPQLNVNGKN